MRSVASDCTEPTGMSIFRFSAEFCFFFTFRFFKNDFPLFLKNRKQKFFFSCTDTATINGSKSFSKQSVTSWFAGMRVFRFWSKFESTVPPHSTQNLMPAAMLRVGVQRGLPGRGRGEGDHQIQAFAPPPFPLSSHHTHTHTHTH